MSQTNFPSSSGDDENLPVATLPAEAQPILHGRVGVDAAGGVILTPETDKQSAKCCLSMIAEYVPADFARDLERRLIECRAALTKMNTEFMRPMERHQLMFDTLTNTASKL